MKFEERDLKFEARKESLEIGFSAAASGGFEEYDDPDILDDESGQEQRKHVMI